jgi:GNAT superfamily N-acetyltransferase
MRLVPATDEQKVQRDHLSYSAWGPPLSVPDYLAREQRLRAHPWSHEALRTWLLRDDAGQVLASCETFRTDSFLRDASGALTPGDSWSIASVFTEESLRGRGHATRLMDLLAAELERASSRAHAALLFSDVGPRIYARSGYQALPAWDWHLPAASGSPAQGVDALLHTSDVARALTRMRQPEAPFFFWPTAPQLDWHLERERIYAERLARPRPPAHGALAGDSTALWCGTGRGGSLLVLMLDARSLADATALLQSAQRVAGQCGLSHVVLWEEPTHAPFLARLPGATRVARDGSLPMVRPLRAGLPLSPLLPMPRGLWV